MGKHLSVKSNESGIAHLVVYLTIVLVFIGATGWYVYSSGKKTNQSQSQQSIKASDEISSLPSDLLSIEKIQKLATAKSPDTSITGIELESEHGQLIYLVRLSDGSNLLFDAKTGDIVTGISVEKDQDKNDNLPKSFSLNISVLRAIEIAKAQYPSGVVKQIELETEDGKVVFSVKFTDGTKVVVDASNGSVIKTKVKTSGAEKSSESSGGSKSEDETKDSSDDLSESSTEPRSGSSSSNNSVSDEEKTGSTSGSGSSGSNSGSGSSSSGSSHNDD